MIKKHGFLYTYTPIIEKDKPFIIENCEIFFFGPEGSKISEKIFGSNKMDKDLWKIIFLRIEFGLRQLHFAILDYYAEKYNLDLELIHHENDLIKRQKPQPDSQVYRSILSGLWELPTRNE